MSARVLFLKAGGAYEVQTEVRGHLRQGAYVRPHRARRRRRMCAPSQREGLP